MVSGGSRVSTRLALRPLAVTTKYTGKILAAATGPIRRKIFRALFKKLITRRARLLSWQRRQSLTPTSTDRQEAQRWATAYVKRKGVLGKLVGAALGAEPVTATLITASIPLLIQLAKKALKTAEGEGAPEDPRAGEEAEA